MSGSCRTPKNEPNAQYNKLFHEKVKNALIPQEAQKYIEQQAKRIKELEDVCRNALTSLAIINMPVQGNPANVAINDDLLKIMADSFEQALKG